MSNDTQNVSFTLKNVRLSFPSLFQKETNQDGSEGKYAASFLLSKSDHATLIEEVAKAITSMAVGKFKRDVPPEKKFMRDGDLYDYDGYEGCWAIKASTKKRPLVINRNKSPITEDDEIIYAGCYVNARISLWAQDNAHGRRINATLLGVQFVKDGEPFGSGESASVDDFDDLGDDNSDPFA